MKPLLLLLVFVLPFAVTAQKVTKVTEPITGQSWWITNQVNIGRSGLSPLAAYFRSSPDGPLIYLNPVTMEPISMADVAVIVTSTDTVIAHPTSVQDGTSTTTREYRISREDLEKLIKSPVLKVSLTRFDGAEVVTVPERNQYKLMEWVKAFLQETSSEK